MTTRPGIEKRRRREGELPTRKVAIRNHCLECCGFNAAEVRRCSAPECWLYPYRMDSPGKGREIAAEELKPPKTAGSEPAQTEETGGTRFGSRAAGDDEVPT